VACQRITRGCLKHKMIKRLNQEVKESTKLEVLLIMLNDRAVLQLAVIYTQLL
jgi:hypothetical protein